MKDKIFVVVKRPFEPTGRIRQISNTLDALQYLVGGYIETVRITDDAVLIVNEEGRIMGLPEQNRTICGERFVGPVVLAGVNGDEFTDAPLDSIMEWEMMLGPAKRKEEPDANV